MLRSRVTSKGGLHEQMKLICKVVAIFLAILFIAAMLPTPAMMIAAAFCCVVLVRAVHVSPPSAGQEYSHSPSPATSLSLSLGINVAVTSINMRHSANRASLTKAAWLSRTRKMLGQTAYRARDQNFARFHMNARQTAATPT